jgi:hypothetical protein
MRFPANQYIIAEIKDKNRRATGHTIQYGELLTNDLTMVMNFLQILDDKTFF